MTVVVLVECPKCSHKFDSVVKKAIKCEKCEKSFQIISKRENRSRIKEIIVGDKTELTRELYEKVYKKPMVLW